MIKCSKCNIEREIWFGPFEKPIGPSLRCPKCGATLLVQGEAVWCSLVPGDTTKGCDWGLAERKTITDWVKPLKEREAKLRVAIEAWICPVCSGSGIRENSDVEHYETVACYKCAWKRTALEVEKGRGCESWR